VSFSRLNKAHISTCHTAANRACEKANGVLINALLHQVNKHHDDTVYLEPLAGNDELRAKLPIVHERGLDITEPKSDISTLHTTQLVHSTARTEQRCMNDRMKNNFDGEIKRTHQL
jgi:hypothetical protein